MNADLERTRASIRTPIACALAALYFAIRPGLFLVGLQHEFRFLAGDEGTGPLLFVVLWLLSLGAAGPAIVLAFVPPRYRPPAFISLPIAILLAALLECALAILHHADDLYHHPAD